MTIPRATGPGTAAAVLALTFLAAACGGRPGDDGRPAGGPPTAEPRTETTMTHVHDDPEVRTRILAADRAFAAEVAAAAGADRARVWAGWFAADGRQLVPGAVIAGTEGIVGLMGPAFADTAFSLHWEPDQGAGAGSWGWTSGRYVSARQGPDGPVRREGRYLTVWQRQQDGTWKVAVDTGVPDGD